MTDRADVIARITDKIQYITFKEPGSLSHDETLAFQGIDSLNVAEIAFRLEEEFGVELEAEPDWTIDKIADLVMAATETARQ